MIGSHFPDKAEVLTEFELKIAEITTTWLCATERNRSYVALGGITTEAFSKK